MGNENQCTSQATIDAGKRVVLLAFDLADQTLANSPDLLAATLKSAKVQEAIKLALNSFILARIPTTSGELSEKDAQALLKTLQGVVTGPISKEVEAKIKNTPQFKALDAGIKDFLATASCTPLGVWVNKNKTLLIVSGVVLAVGGTAALFVTKTGGPAVNLPLGLLKDAKIPIFKLGSLSGGVTIGDLKPSLREAGAGVVLTDKFDSMSVDLKIGATAFFTPSRQVPGAVLTKSSVFTIDPSGGAAKNNRISLGLTLRSNADTFSATIGAIWEQDQAPKATLDARLKLNDGVSVGVKGEASQHGQAVLATVNLLNF
jgi:hypothetical protein